MSIVSPIKKQPSLREQAFASIRNAIVRGRLVPGSLVSEQSIADQVGVSRTPVREALLQLAEEGFVEFVRNSGVRITALSNEHMEEVFTLRACIEGFCARMIADAEDKRAEVVPQLRSLLAEQQAIVASGDHTLWVDANMDFHMLIVKSCNNALMIDTLAHLRGHTMRIGYQLNESVHVRMQQSLAEHTLIVDQIAAGKGAAAARLVESHMHATTELMKQQLSRQRGGLA